MSFEEADCPHGVLLKDPGNQPTFKDGLEMRWFVCARCDRYFRVDLLVKERAEKAKDEQKP